MSLGVLHDMLDEHLQTLPGFNAEACAWPGVPFTPTPGVPYLAPRLSALTRAAAGAGTAGAVRWTGTYQVAAVFPAGRGLGGLAVAVDALLGHFARGRSLLGADGTLARFQVPRPMPAFTTGAWVQAVVLCDFFADEFPG